LLFTLGNGNIKKGNEKKLQYKDIYFAYSVWKMTENGGRNCTFTEKAACKKLSNIYANNSIFSRVFVCVCSFKGYVSFLALDTLHPCLPFYLSCHSFALTLILMISCSFWFPFADAARISGGAAWRCLHASTS